MNTCRQIILSFLPTLALLAIGFPAHAVIKCQDAEGNWYMGDTLPPECAQQGYQQLNEQGLLIEETEAAKNEEEIAEAKRQAEIQAEKDRIAEEKALKDRILMDTFSTVEDLELARDGKLAAIDTTIGLAEKRNEKIKVDLEKLVAKAAADERAGKEPDEQLINDIETLRRQIDNNTQFIADKGAEKESVKADYASDIERFKELKGIQ